MKHMKTKTLIELLTLSSNMYLIAKDDDFWKRVSEMTEKGRKTINKVMDEFSDEEGEENSMFQKLIEKAKQAREELEQKMEEVAVKAYKKMRIAHTDEIKKLETEMELLNKQLALAEARIIIIEQKKS